MEDEALDTCFGPGSVAGAVIGTFLTTILLLSVAALLYRQWRRHKGKHLVLVTDPEIVEDAYAFDNPCFKDVTPSVGRVMERSIITSAETPTKDSARWTTPWTSLGLGSANRNDKRRTLDDSCLGPKATRVSVVSLRSRDFTGLGFNVCGNMREGIFVKDLLHRGPASESGRIHPVLDSSGEPKPGFVHGNNFWLGIRTNCLDTMNKSPLVLSKPFLVNNTRYRNPKEEFPPFKVNYFVAHFRHNSTMQYHVRIHNEDLITLGLCLPASCSIDEIDMVLKRMFHNRTLLVGRLYSADFKLVEVRDLKDDQQWLINGKLIFVGLLLVTTCVIMLISTMYDIFVYQSRLKEKKKHVTHDEHNTMDKRTKGIPENVEAVITIPQHKRPMEQILMCFSIYTNTKKIFNTDVNSDLIHAIHGLRFLGMVWIILVHTIFYVQDYGDNMPWAWRMSEGFAAQIISNSTLSVDTYFFLSGYLLSYVYLCSHKDKENYKLIDYRSKLNEILITIVKRFIRLTPAYMMMIGIVELNMGWYSNTSLFYMTERPQNSCAKYWWRNLLYINNLFRAETMCVSWSWYLSNDMQFFIIGIFLLNLMSIYLYAAMIILGGLLFGSILLTGYISYIYEYVPTLDTQYQNLDLLYYPPWTRIGPYIVGILAAYILIKLNKKLELKKRNIVICWLFGSSCNILVLFGLWERHISVVSTAFYVGLSRTVWGVGLAWIVIACQTNHGGIINQILSFKGWIPLSRLTYCAYLLNPFIINSVYLYGESSIHVDFLSIGTAFMGNVLNSYFCAYMLSLMFEMPYIELLRILFYPRNKRK